VEISTVAFAVAVYAQSFAFDLSIFVTEVPALVVATISFQVAVATFQIAQLTASALDLSFDLSHLGAELQGGLLRSVGQLSSSLPHPLRLLFHLAAQRLDLGSRFFTSSAHLFAARLDLGTHGCHLLLDPLAVLSETLLHLFPPRFELLSHGFPFGLRLGVVHVVADLRQALSLGLGKMGAGGGMVLEATMDLGHGFVVEVVVLDSKRLESLLQALLHLPHRVLESLVPFAVEDRAEILVQLLRQILMALGESLEPLMEPRCFLVVELFVEAVGDPEVERAGF
jgi:hypothetical protein